MLGVDAFNSVQHGLGQAHIDAAYVFFKLRLLGGAYQGAGYEGALVDPGQGHLRGREAVFLREKDVVACGRFGGWVVVAGETGEQGHARVLRLGAVKVFA